MIKSLNFLLYVSFFFFNFKSLFALQAYCDFEEVYQDGQTQQGAVLINNFKLRYEYYDPNLYTIFYDGKDLVIVNNKDRNLKNYEHQYKKLINIVYDVLKMKDKENQTVLTDEYEINLEKSISGDFYRRMSIQSAQINLSIYFNNCSNKSINTKYFSLNPVIDLIL